LGLHSHAGDDGCKGKRREKITRKLKKKYTLMYKKI
jgi:hypothetical protein